MKRLKLSQLIHIWEDYEFYLNIPKSFKGTNKPFIFFYYNNPKTNKSERIRRQIQKNQKIEEIKEGANWTTLQSFTSPYRAMAIFAPNWNSEMYQSKVG